MCLFTVLAVLPIGSGQMRTFASEVLILDACVWQHLTVGHGARFTMPGTPVVFN